MVLDQVDKLDLEIKAVANINDKAISRMLDEVDKLEDQVSQQELLQYEMERELMKRSPRAKLMRRNTELE